MLFYDGTPLAICQEAPARVVYAATERGSRVVVVCTARFEALQRKAPVWGDVVVIHEMLPRSGLGEAPPSSEDITWQVMESCSERPGVKRHLVRTRSVIARLVGGFLPVPGCGASRGSPWPPQARVWTWVRAKRL